MIAPLLPHATSTMFLHPFSTFLSPKGKDDREARATPPTEPRAFRASSPWLGARVQHTGTLRMSVWFLVVSSFSLSSCCCFSPCLDNAVLAQTLLVRHAHVHSHPHCQASLAYTRMCMCFHTPTIGAQQILDARKHTEHSTCPRRPEENLTPGVQCSSGCPGRPACPTR